MTTFDEHIAAYRERLSTHGVKTVGGAEISLCPLCPEVHVMCVFESGYLGCVKPNCPNPHHRNVRWARPHEWARIVS